MADNVAALGVLADLIDYPTCAMQGTLDAAWAVLLADRRLPRAELHRLDEFIAALRRQELSVLQEDYIGIFRGGRGVSLYLGDHQQLDSAGDNAAAGVLRALYEKQGLYLHQGEMPDYLPVFLDFLAQQPWKRARQLLAERVATLTEIAFHLSDIGSGYSIPVAALVALTGAPPLVLARMPFSDTAPPPVMTVDLSTPAREAGRAPDFFAVAPNWSALSGPTQRASRRRH